MPPARAISVFGLGYVGSVTAACCASLGFRVTGVDVHPDKVAKFAAGEAPIAEPGLDELLREQQLGGRIFGSTEASAAILETDLSIVCVGTPSLPSGALDLRHVEAVTRQISEALQAKTQPHVLIFRSTMLPGSTRRLCQNLLRTPIESGRLKVYFFPEFLRQGSALEDFLSPSLSALGAAEAGESPDPLLAGLIGPGTAVVAYEEAELLKYACNAFHATKVAFANEIGRIGKSLSINGSRVMELLCEDTRLNISPYYLRPGTPFGGSCLPKDVSALTVFARSQETSAPLLDSLLPTNERHLQSLLELVERSGSRRVLLLGLAFKAGTDDLRSSAMLELAAALLLRDFEVRIFDPLVSSPQLIGANERFARLRLPNLATVLIKEQDLPMALACSDVIVASKKCVPLDTLRPLVTERHHVIDVNGWPELAELAPNYEGFCW